MYILGIDYGTKKLGFALLEPESGVISQLPIIKNDQFLLPKIAKLLADYRVRQVVFGLPSYADTQRKVKNFAQNLKNQYKIEIDFTSEDNTSIVTKKLTTSQKQKENLDSMSAVEILTQWYTDKIRQ